jgi:catechol 2,3-dioxygenase-like lactoylglutathione lyase family enzyme
MAPTIEKISAVTLRVANMTESVRFYRDVLGMELLYGGEGTAFSSLRAGEAQSAILNLEQGEAVTRWGAADLPRHGCGRPLESSEGPGI